MTVIVGAASSRSSSRTKAPGRLSLNRLRSGASGAGSSHSTVGGGPLAGADAKPTRDIKHRFEITRKLGSGTYGKVSLAYDHKTEREVAVKLIKKSAIENKQDLIRIRREIRIMSMLKHPNIIEIYEVFENVDKIILIMEFASSGELYDYVGKHGSLAEAEARRIFRQITSAVLYCHKNKVAHRDLKLENILLDANNNAKIADFGLSNYFNEKTLLHTFCGSPLYASPEIINGTPYRGPEVDCWASGVILYTLVYGSMPFDGQDFNRMVRQIKRGAYYEPDTPSTASMLIRNLLRVNADRRADIEDVANHWWLHLSEDMPAIQELPENQIIDFTPLNERAEVLHVQDLADETDVFMEFGSETRKKIEEFRRRRQNAEAYNDASPIKPPKARKTEGEELTSRDKSLRSDAAAVEQPTSSGAGDRSAFSDPLERLRQLETRLQTRHSPEQPSTSAVSTSRRGSRPNAFSDFTTTSLTTAATAATPPPVPLNMEEEERKKKPAFVSPSAAVEPVEGRKSLSKKSLDSGSWRTADSSGDSLLVLMNQVLEAMERGPVSLNLIARVKAHQAYEHRSSVKELLESILAAQPAAVRKEASKVIEQQQAPTSPRKLPPVPIGMRSVVTPTAAETKTPTHKSPAVSALAALKTKYHVADLPASAIDPRIAAAQRRNALEDRKWHSVEVGFASDDDSADSSNASDDAITIGTPAKRMTAAAAAPRARSAEEAGDEEASDECEDEEEGSDVAESEIDELAEVVDQVTSNARPVAPPTIVASHVESTPMPPTIGEPSADHLSTLDRGLAKRQSKGKYQQMKMELYGRGGSSNIASPPPERRRIGGPQPSSEQLPDLFDKATKYLTSMGVGDSDDEASAGVNAKSGVATTNAKWNKTQDPDVGDKSATATPTPTRRASNTSTIAAPIGVAQPSSTRPAAAVAPSAASASRRLSAPKATAEVDDEDEEEESEDEGEPLRRPRTSAIVGFRTILAVDEDMPPPTSTPTTTATATATARISMPRSSPTVVETNNKTRESTGTESRHPATKPYGGIAKQSPPIVSNVGSDKTIVEKSKIPAAIPERSAIPTSIPTAEPTPISTQTSADREPLAGVIRRPSITARIERRLSQFERRNSRTNGGDETTTALERQNSRSSATRTSVGDDARARLQQHSDRRHSRDIGAIIGGRQTTTDRPTSAYESTRGGTRFEVYQTRAEREAAAATAGGFRGPHHYGASDRVERPTSQYAGGLRSRFDDYSAMRRPVGVYDERSYDFEPNPYYLPADYPSNLASPADAVFAVAVGGRSAASRCLARRDRRTRTRSQSGDRHFPSGTGLSTLDMDGVGGLASLGPTAADYSYTGLYDTANSRVSQPREIDLTLREPSRGILKNKLAYEHEPRASQTRDIGASGGGGGDTPRHIDAYESATSSSSAKNGRPSSNSTFLSNLTRRRTAEIRLGNDGKLTTTSNGVVLDDDSYSKRPRSPIDRIKSLFGAGSGSTAVKKSTGISNDPYSSGTTTTFASRYGATIGASTNTPLKRYTGASTNTRFVPQSRANWYD